MSKEGIAWLLIALAVGDVVITYVAIQLARKRNNPALTDRAATSLLETICAVGLAVLSAAFIAQIEIPDPALSIIFIGVLVLLSVPNYIWAIQLLLGRFR